MEKKFPAKPKDDNQKSFITELRELRQEPEETITVYYKRVLKMMAQVDVRDRPTSTVDERLSFLEESMLDTILETFTRGFIDDYISKKTIQGLEDPNKSVMSTYNLAECARLSQLAVKVAADSKSKDKQREFLWDIVKQNMSAERIGSLFTLSEQSPMPEEWRADLATEVKTNLNPTPPYIPRHSSAPPYAQPRQNPIPYVPSQKLSVPSLVSRTETGLTRLPERRPNSQPSSHTPP